MNVPLCVLVCQDPKDAVADEFGESAGGVQGRYTGLELCHSSHLHRGPRGPC